MSKAPPLSKVEQGKIDLLVKQKKNIYEIIEELVRSFHVIKTYMDNPLTYGIKKSSNRPKKLSKRVRNKIIKLARNKKITAKKIIALLDLKISKSTILRIIKNQGKLIRKRIKRKPSLKSKHKTNRLVFAGEYKGLGPKWKNVVFSDEKKFNLDGPDGYNYYWADIDKKSPIYSRRVMGGDSVMI